MAILSSGRCRKPRGIQINVPGRVACSGSGPTDLTWWHDYVVAALLELCLSINELAQIYTPEPKAAFGRRQIREVCPTCRRISSARVRNFSSLLKTGSQRVVTLFQQTVRMASVTSKRTPSRCNPVARVRQSSCNRQGASLTLSVSTPISAASERANSSIRVSSSRQSALSITTSQTTHSRRAGGLPATTLLAAKSSHCRSRRRGRRNRVHCRAHRHRPAIRGLCPDRTSHRSSAIAE